MKCKQRWFGSVVACAMSVACLGSTAVQAGQNVIVFGDSLSDMGNNTWVSDTGYHGAPITNQPTQVAKELWPNLLVSALHGVPVNKNDPYLSSTHQKSGYNPYTDDVNYAYASAESGADYVNDLDFSKGYPPYINCTQPGLLDKTHACVPGAIYQVKTYLSEVSNQPNPNSIFLIWVGGNDFFNDVSKLLATAHGSSKALSRGFTELDAVMANRQSAQDIGVTFSNPVGNIRKAVDLLLQAGVSKNNIFVFNLPDMSKVPAAVQMAKGNKLILGAISVLSAIYNTSLKADLCYNMLDKKGNLSTDRIFKINQLFKLIDSNKGLDSRYHLTDLVDSCVAKGAYPVCQGYAFFNGKHPTLSVEHVVSDYFDKLLSQSKK